MGLSCAQIGAQFWAQFGPKFEPKCGPKFGPTFCPKLGLMMGFSRDGAEAAAGSLKFWGLGARSLNCKTPVLIWRTKPWGGLG